jgi:hypothetical protein
MDCPAQIDNGAAADGARSGSGGRGRTSSVAVREIEGSRDRPMSTPHDGARRFEWDRLNRTEGVAPAIATISRRRIVEGTMCQMQSRAVT